MLRVGHNRGYPGGREGWRVMPHYARLAHTSENREVLGEIHQAVRLESVKS